MEMVRLELRDRKRAELEREREELVGLDREVDRRLALWARRKWAARVRKNVAVGR